MECFCGLDVAVDETAVCVVDEHGEVHLMVKVETDPDALLVALKRSWRGCGMSAMTPDHYRPGCIPSC